MTQKKLVSALFLTALTAASTAFGAADPALLAARQKFFGIENVDTNTAAVKKDKVIFSWATNTTYAVSVLGRVILLDTYVNRPEVVPGRTPFVVEDLVALRPEAIFLGHGHFDHADNAAFIAKNLNIPIYASPETCDAMQNDAVRIFGAGSTVTCTPVVSRGSVPGAEVVRLAQLEPLACIVAFKHIHSGSVPYDPTYPKVTIDNVADARDATMYPAGTRHSFATVAGTGGPISLMYQFVLRSGYNFNFVWHNTTGPLKEGVGSDPGLPSPVVGQRLFDIMGSLPRTDVEFGSVVSLGFTNNGERDVVMYNQALRSQVYVPGHVTDVALPSSSPEWRLGWIRQNDAMGVPQAQRPEIRHWLVDPLDYLRPLVYTPGDPRWFDPAKAARVQAMCG